MARDREMMLRESLVVEPPAHERRPADGSRLGLALEELRRVRAELAHAGAEADTAITLLERARALEASPDRRDAVWGHLASTCGQLDQIVNQLADDTSDLLDKLTALGARHLVGGGAIWSAGQEIDATDIAAPFEEDPRDAEIERLRHEIARMHAALDNASARVLQGGLAHVIGVLQPEGPRAEPQRSPFDRLSIGAGVRELLTVVLSEPSSRELTAELSALNREVETALGKDQYLVWDDFVCERSEVSNRREEAALQAGAPFGVLLGLAGALHPDVPLAELALDPARLARIAQDHGAPQPVLDHASTVFHHVAESERAGQLTFAVDQTLREARIAAIGGSALAEAELHLEDVALEVSEALPGPAHQRWMALRQLLRVRAHLREDAAFQAGVQLGIPVGCAAAMFPGEPLATVFSSPERAGRLLASLGYRLEQLPALVQLTLRTVFEGQDLV